MNIADALDFVFSRVLHPALVAQGLSQRAINDIQHSASWMNKFKRIGDLYLYLNRFNETPSNSEVFQELSHAGLETFESILDEFNARFGRWQHDQTKLTDFVIGQQYSSWDLAIFTQTYDVRSGGILVIGEVPQHAAVFLKVNLSGGKYPNKWLDHGQRLKTYLKSRRNPHTGVTTFNPEHVENRAVLMFPTVPIYVFTRPEPGGHFLLDGIFSCQRMHEESDGSKWFDLIRQSLIPSQVLEDQHHFAEGLASRVQAAQKDSPEARKVRLAQASGEPRTIQVVTKEFYRNPDVIAEVLHRAKGTCEKCKQDAPFLRKKDDSPYLEVHHRIPLADGGKDTVENALAVCPNCHRQAHFG